MTFLPNWRAAVARLRARLLPNWLDVYTRSWSVRCNALAGVVLATAYCWPSGLSWLPEWAQLVPLALVGLALLLRVVAQKGLSLPGEDG